MLSKYQRIKAFEAIEGLQSSGRVSFALAAWTGEIKVFCSQPCCCATKGPGREEEYQGLVLEAEEQS